MIKYAVCVKHGDKVYYWNGFTKKTALKFKGVISETYPGNYTIGIITENNLKAWEIDQSVSIVH